jgi:hypothetical protein
LVIIIILGEEYKSRSSKLCSFLDLAVTLSLCGLNILLSTLFSNTVYVPTHDVRNQVSHPYRTTGKIVVLYILILAISNSIGEDWKYWTEW